MKVPTTFAVMLTAAATAHAQPVSGFYVQGGAGLTLPQQQSVSLPSAVPSNRESTPEDPRENAPEPSAAATADAAINSKTGTARAGSFG